MQLCFLKVLKKLFTKLFYNKNKNIKERGRSMIISKTPFRMSFFGGGTDIPDYFKKYGGEVISTSIDKYCYVSIRKLPRFFNYNNQINYYKIERTKEVEDIEHPLVRESLKYLDVKDIILNYDADLPARSGLGTSSSFAVGLLNSLYNLKGVNVDKRKLADDAILIERDICKEDGGWQDQIAASFGGFNKITFCKDGKYVVKPLKLSNKYIKKLNKNMLLFFTGFTRMSYEVQKDNKHKSYDQIEVLNEMRSVVRKAESILIKEEISQFGRLLDYNWKLKKMSGNKISNNVIDYSYEVAKYNGAIGGKLLGAGGGGFMLIFADPECHDNIKKELKYFTEVPFKFENSGSEIIFNSNKDIRKEK